MEAKRPWLALTCALLGLSAFGNDALAKAKTFIQRVYDLEAIVTRVELSDNPGDADYNLVLRPPAEANKAALFINTFWNPTYTDSGGDSQLSYYQQYINGMVSSAYSAECKQCAGTGPTGTGCKFVEGKAYPGNPCPALFKCASCLYDINRAGKAGLNRLFPEAEIFFGSGWSDINDNLRSAMSFLGMTGCSGDGDQCCVEFTWDQGQQKWARTAKAYPNGTSICGKRVRLSGWVTVEGQHEAKPEIHPISTMAVQEGAPGQWTVAAFIDGSHPPFDTCAWWEWILNPIGCAIVEATSAVQAIWMFDYRSMADSQSQYPSNPFLDLAALQPPKGQLEWGTATAGGTEIIDKECSWTEQYSLNVTSVKQIASSDPQYCPKLQVTMNRAASSGAAWVATVKAGWKRKQYGLSLGAKLETPGGVLTENPLVKLLAVAGIPLRDMTVSASRPMVDRAAVTSAARAGARARARTAGPVETTVSIAPRVAEIAAGALGLASGAKCEVSTAKTGPDPELRRWYKWTITPQVTVAQESGVTLTWSFTSTPSDLVFVPDPRGKSPGSVKSFDVWMPVPVKQPQNLLASSSYSGDLTVYLRRNGKAVAWSTVPLIVDGPEARITTTKPVLNQSSGGPVYDFTIQATASRFCGDANQLQYAWERINTPPAVYAWWNTKLPPQPAPPPAPTGTGPAAVSIAPGQSQTFSVWITDPWGVEYAQATRVISPPHLTVLTARKCGDGEVEASRSARLGPRTLGRASIATSFAKELAIPSGYQGTTAMDLSSTMQLCQKVVVGGIATETEGIGADFGTTKQLQVNFAWTDLKYQSEATKQQWVDMPAGWWTVTNEGLRSRLTLQSSTKSYYRFQATVTATDQWGRKAVTNVTGSNDFTDPAQLAKRLQALWKMMTQRLPMPGPDPCMVCGKGFLVKFEGDFARLLHQAQNPRGGEGFALQQLRDEIAAFTRMGLLKAGADRNLRQRWVPPSAPVFRLKATKAPWGKEIQVTSKVLAQERLAKSPAFVKRLDRLRSFRGTNLQLDKLKQTTVAPQIRKLVPAPKSPVRAR